MRILAVTHQFPTVYQPTFAPYNRQQWSELARSHDVHIVRAVPWTIAWQQRRSGMWQGAGPMPSAVGSPAISVSYPRFYFPPKWGSHLYGHWFEWSTRAVVAREVATWRPDVLLTSWAHPDGWATAKLAKRFGLPVVLKVLGSDVLVQATGKRRAYVSESVKAMTAVAAVSADLARHVVELGADPARVHVVPEGLSFEEFSPGDQQAARAQLGITGQEPMILFVGSVIAAKGVFDLVDACARLRDRQVRFQCCIVGKGGDLERVRQTIETLGLGRHVTCAGLRPHAELAQWFRASDVVALPSYTEGIPNVLREAIACGRPFVSTRVGGIPEIADPSLSRLTNAGDVDGLAAHLESILNDPLDVDSGVVRRINISWQESARRLERLLLDAVASRTQSL
ncbi:MAG: glycosyltransferase [Vicinamibacterales bacterium]